MNRSRPRLPLLLADIELTQPLWSPTPKDDGSGRRDLEARLLVRLGGRPIGLLETRIPVAGVDRRALARQIIEQLGDSLVSRLRAGASRPTEAALLEGIPTHEAGPHWRDLVGDPLPSATIVINTCGGRGHVVETIRTALDQDYPAFEVMVVDNRPEASGLPALLARRLGVITGLRYETEPIPGLGNGRNRGLQSTRTEIVAFTDDDVILDRCWLGSLVSGFSVADRVACVTGLILPKELQTPAQLWLEEFGGFGKGFERRVWDRTDNSLNHPLYPYQAGIFGSGANAAFKRDLLLELGGFDPFLGAGTPTLGAEDLDIYTRVVLEGYRLVYEPAALLRHAHHREMPALRRQIWACGTSLAAMLTKYLLLGPATRGAVVRRIPAGIAYFLSPRSPKNRHRTARYPLALILIELLGMAYGPVAYIRSRLRKPSGRLALD